MICKACSGDNCIAIDSRTRPDGTRRRRYRCMTCGARHSTIEIYSDDYTRYTEAFERDKTVRKVVAKMSALIGLLDVPTDERNNDEN